MTVKINSKTLYLKTKKFLLVCSVFIIQMKCLKKKDFLFLRTNLMNKYSMLVILKNIANLFLKNKNASLVKVSKIFTQRPKSIENINSTRIK